MLPTPCPYRFAAARLALATVLTAFGCTAAARGVDKALDFYAWCSLGAGLGGFVNARLDRATQRSRP